METGALPIDELLEEIRQSLHSNSTVIVNAFAGSGKTTRIPPALLSHFNGKILVLEPRRIAARLAAEWVAEELGEQCGNTVGYQVRYEDVSTADTKLKYITEGLLLRYMCSNATLEGIDCVILDEFHERHLHTDVAFALLRNLQMTSRPDLRLIIMSATMNVELLSRRAERSRTFSMEGKFHPLTIEYMSSPADRPLRNQVSLAVKEMFLDLRCQGHLLVFLPGLAEINASIEALNDFAEKHGALLLELRSETPADKQRMVFSPSEKRKIILATNVAETSVTINGVTGVIDSGLARIAGFAHWSGLPTLDVRPVSQASCIQRAGRAGRTSPGIVKRLYTEHDYLRRPQFERPEITRSDLSQILLETAFILSTARGKGTTLPELPWLEDPPLRMIDSACDLLKILGAFDENGDMTSLGRHMSSYPLHPRLARIAVKGRALDCEAQALLAAALIAEGMPVKKGVPERGKCESDIGLQYELFCELEVDPHSLDRHASIVDRGRFRRIKRAVESLCRGRGLNWKACLTPPDDEELAELILSGFPDRVAQQRAVDRQRSGTFTHPAKAELNFCLGGGGTLSRTSAVTDSRFLIAVLADEKTADSDAATAISVYAAQGASPELLALSGSSLVREESLCFFDEAAGRVRRVERLLYGRLVLEECYLNPDDKTCEELLAEALRNSWPRPFRSDDALCQYASRVSLLKEKGIQCTFPDLKGEDFGALLRHICSGKRSFDEIASRSLDEYIESMQGTEAAHTLALLAPQRIHIGCNRKAPVHYEEGKKPWVASRLQDFFGVTETPRIAGGKVPLVVHLCGPGGQVVQVTADLKSFWSNSYPSVRKELSRQYPKHYWPENPETAEPRIPGRGNRRQGK